ncbi:hypothetical protein ACOTJF_18505 [Achromobacter ruhlandii]|uniref:hypothetical protein n=1 Tax=Achromobacter ruhlandii TaxID=72557 RepID=UPI003BA04474
MTPSFTPAQQSTAANAVLSDIRETSQRCRAMLETITGDGFAYFSLLDDELQEAYLHQVFMLVVEVNHMAGTTLAAQGGGAE